MTIKETKELFARLKPEITARIKAGQTWKTIATDLRLNYDRVRLYCHKWKLAPPKRQYNFRGSTTIARYQPPILTEKDIDTDIKTRIFPANYKHGISFSLIEDYQIKYYD